MSRGAAVAAGCLVTLAVLVQVTVLSRVPPPGGGPALLVLVVAAVAASYGPTAGMLAGFAGGVLADLTPPSDHPLGQAVLVLVVLGELIGLLARRPAGPARPVILVGAATGLAGVGVPIVGLALGQPLGSVTAWLAGTAAATAYNLALAVLALPLIGRLGQPAGMPAWQFGQGAGLAGRSGGRRRRYRGSAPAGGLR